MKKQFTCSVVFAMAIVVSMSCSRIDAMIKLNRMMKSEIRFPQYVLADSVGFRSFRPLPHGTKLVAYMDSSDCKSCVLPKLSRFNELSEKGVTSKSYLFVALVSVTEEDLSETLSIIEQGQYCFPIYIDVHNEFLKMNAFIPMDRRFRFFLVDEEGKVIFVGDPTASDNLEKVFSDVIEKIDN